MNITQLLAYKSEIHQVEVKGIDGKVNIKTISLGDAQRIYKVGGNEFVAELIAISVCDKDGSPLADGDSWRANFPVAKSSEWLALFNACAKVNNFGNTEAGADLGKPLEQTPE